MSKTDNTDPYHVKIAHLPVASLEAIHAGCAHDTRPRGRYVAEVIHHEAGYVLRELVVTDCCERPKKMLFEDALHHFKAVHENEFLYSLDALFAKKPRRSPVARVEAMPKVIEHVWCDEHDEVVKRRVVTHRECDIDAGQPGYGWLRDRCSYVVRHDSPAYTQVYAGCDKLDHGHKPARRNDKQALKQTAVQYNSYSRSERELDPCFADDLLVPDAPNPAHQCCW